MQSGSQSSLATNTFMWREASSSASEWDRAARLVRRLIATTKSNNFLLMISGPLVAPVSTPARHTRSLCARPMRADSRVLASSSRYFEAEKQRYALGHLPAARLKAPTPYASTGGTPSLQHKNLSEI